MNNRTERLGETPKEREREREWEEEGEYAGLKFES